MLIFPVTSAHIPAFPPEIPTDWHQQFGNWEKGAKIQTVPRSWASVAASETDTDFPQHLCCRTDCFSSREMTVLPPVITAVPGSQSSSTWGIFQ